MIRGRNRGVPADDSSYVMRGVASQYDHFQRHYDAALAPGIITDPYTPFPAKYTDIRTPPLTDKELVAQALGQKVSVTVPLTEEDVRITKEKLRLQQVRSFDEWIGRSYPPDSPAAREWLQQVYPEFFEARAKEIDDQAEMETRMKKIQLRGPKDLEDLWLLYRLQSDVELQERTASQYMAPSWKNEKFDQEPNTKIRALTFERGLFNPRRLEALENFRTPYAPPQTAEEKAADNKKLAFNAQFDDYKKSVLAKETKELKTEQETK